MPAILWKDEYNIEGHWGPVTSTLDWCEENYIILWHVAEFWNTLSNLAILIPSAFALYQILLDKSGILLFLTTCSIILVGIGSTLFHGTLKYEMQLLDEIPMMVAVSLLLLFLVNLDDIHATSQKTLIFGFTLMIVLTLSASFYIYTKNYLFFEVYYGTIFFSSFVYCFYLARKHKLTQYARIAYAGFAITLIAFLIWNIENHFCIHLRIIRSKLGIFSPLVQFHALWHILCGIATHLIGTGIAQMKFKYRKIPFIYKWFLGFVPVVSITKVYP